MFDLMGKNPFVRYLNFLLVFPKIGESFVLTIKLGYVKNKDQFVVSSKLKSYKRSLTGVATECCYAKG
ncbi:hypothetical protein JP35_10345 [Gallibacterium anatis]|uniref:Uncharacterized protein n=1 Tax=Gallibacterium anatis TaxID=750 RepID=A0A0A2YGN1_9PAST|nr:hypothetical protein JP32_12070 [Gallibacterium anatis]KGQ36514.1 hypothetical protein JP35_10345 [Gallibacterium anatis]